MLVVRERKASGKKRRKTVLIGARVPETFHRRIQSECVQREMSLQAIIVSALEHYFRKSPAGLRQAEVRFRVDAPKLTDEDTAERIAWSGLWAKYMDKMPREKIEIMANVFKWELQMLRSSRRKPVRLSTLSSGKEIKNG
jgi:hypothetical protein